MYFSRHAKTRAYAGQRTIADGDHVAYLIDQIDEIDNIEVHTCTQVVAARARSTWSGLTLRNSATGETREVDTEWMFVFIGAAPRTDWLPGDLLRDERGFVLTGPDLRGGRRAGRWSGSRTTWRRACRACSPPGDVRAESVKRVASAVGDGAMAVTLVHRYLEML